MRQIHTILEASAKSALTLLQNPGTGFYIPAYQRPYSWARRHVRRLVDDISHGIDALLHKADAFTFIGTVITVNDQSHTSIEPIDKPNTPASVMTIIDGQQRLTTLLLLFTSLHRLIVDVSIRQPSESSRDIDDPKLIVEQDAQSWLLKHRQSTLPQLMRTLQEDQHTGDDDYRWYPSLIRAYVDCWSPYRVSALYESDIAAFLHEYCAHARVQTTGSFKPSKTVVSTRYDQISERLEDHLESSDAESEFPSVRELIESANLGNSLFNEPVPPAVAQALADRSQSTLRRLFKLLIFARFALHHVAITVVTSQSEDDAFDMFESLNTTGTPLTAFETFRPRVIKEEGYKEYKTSTAARYMGRIEKYLKKHSNRDQRTRTNEFLTAFALAETAYKMPRQLSAQRYYLRQRFEELDTSDAKLSFIRHMADSVALIQHTWNPKTRPKSGPTLPQLGELSSTAKMCLEVLRDAKHNIVMSPLIRILNVATSRSVEKSLGQSSEQPGLDLASMEEAIKAITAFFALWRGAHGTTQNIDSKYRTLMAGRNSQDEGAERELLGLARSQCQDNDTSDLLVGRLKDFLAEELHEADLNHKEMWIRRAARVPTYIRSRPLARLLLLAGLHDTVPDPDAPGLLLPAKDGVLDLLNYEGWTNEKNLTVEHIAPQHSTGRARWHASLDQENVHHVGNLVLVSRSINSTLSDRSWEEKRAIYRVIAARSKVEAQQRLKQARSEGISFEFELPKVYVPVTASLATVKGPWDATMVQRRSECLLGLAWDRLAPWLGIEDGDQACESFTESAKPKSIAGLWQVALPDNTVVGTYDTRHKAWHAKNKRPGSTMISPTKGTV